METEVLSCRFCSYPTIEAFYYCPNCGKSLKTPPFSTSVLKQIGIYSLSLLLPPLGLWPGIKYLMQSDKKAKTIGLIAIALTVISSIITVWLSINLINQITQSFMGQTNIDQYQGLGL
ncbi:MAG: hypothetical protein CO135_00100 [Candidatus Levybacteria bacterium CG_4_9_14_3_um_filter_35_16]|nr:MAG: hypothetical protein COW87_02785 [Candidatus Levybacteria bacterium CG22_combo_CG10-13_8_21_14_all_35_11]PIY95012.1 MAG: hypothetical protein COY68_00495 [Candidatus Levybacteria bacterium CG_4_10_14_0_8_um_filter_35_23]PJA00252.1 MAG: hypothetical protein COX78_00725 [Candidatus Levybacteria bacterium CG_4_10_14_0_2_um_filter_35_8]PJA91652.1 MAG: hypothetical protein CO135_00100 [Candidatus Levybacteria bacterium CG_4_9_14_3_um_filter_35_16]PJC54834.1 MAG: hypothetical protein CO028_00